MNDAQKKAADYAEILLAFSRGDRVEYLADAGWRPVCSPHFDFGMYEYRIAPKPVERWALVNDRGDLVNHFQTRERAERYQTTLAAQTKIVHLREVTE